MDESEGSSNDIEKCFGVGVSLYEILGVVAGASAEEIKKGYRKKALIHHPDKGGDPEHFKALCCVHAILSNEESRKLYDETGEIDGDSDSELNGKDFDEWYEYFRNLFPKLTVDAIDQFSNEYKGSDEEREDIFNAYIARDGNIKYVFDNVMLLEAGEEARLCVILDEGIAGGVIQTTSSYTIFRQQHAKAIATYINSDSYKSDNLPAGKSTETKKSSKSVKKTKVQASSSNRKKKNDMESLESLILNRSNLKRQEDMYDNLLKKYGSSSSSSKKSKKKEMKYEDIDDESFHKARMRMQK